MSQRNYSPSMGVHYTEAQLDEAADAYIATKYPMHSAIGTAERRALQAHRRLIDQRQDDMAATILAEFGMADS